MKISKASVDLLPMPDRDTFYWDENLAGFGVKVTPAGKKVFVLQTRLNGRTRRFTIGAYGQPWSPDAARLEAKKLMGQVSNGVDPQLEKTEKRSDITVRQLGEIYWKSVTGHKKTTTIANERGLEKRHIDPLVGSRRLKELSRHHIQKMVNDIAAGKTALDLRTKPRGRARVTGGRGSANRTFGLLSSMLSFAVEQKYITENPALGVKQFKLKRHDRYLSVEEMGRLGDALSTAENDGASSYAVAAIRFLAMTGCRRNEALELQWDWIDFQHGIAKLPDSKTGQKNLILGATAVDFVRSLPKVAGSKLIFSSAVGGTTPISIQKVWKKVKEAAGLQDLRLHDLRHNFASSAVSSGQSLYVVGKLLGHSQPTTTQRYAHLAPDPMQEAADDIAKKLFEKLKPRGSIDAQ